MTDFPLATEGYQVLPAEFRAQDADHDAPVYRLSYDLAGDGHFDLVRDDGDSLPDC